MDHFQNFIDLMAPYGIILLPLCLLGMYWSKRRLDGIRSAAWLVANQFEPAPPGHFEEVITFADSRGKKDRVVKLFTRAKVELGRENLKIGHVLWLMTVGIEESTPLDDIEIPKFAREETSPV